MKTVKILAIAAALVCCVAASAQDKNRGQEWKERMMAEKVAFITSELQLTPEEAQVFWPVYNKESQKRDEAFHNTMKTYRQLQKAVNEGGDCEAALNAYLKALDESKGVEAACAKAYKKVLPIEKVAKLFLAEEKFRREQIGRLGRGPQGGHQPGGKPGMQPGGKPGMQPGEHHGWGGQKGQRPQCEKPAAE